MKRSVSIYKVLGLFVLLAFLTGCAKEKDRLGYGGIPRLGDPA
jgi:hypothetical protein